MDYRDIEEIIDIRTSGDESVTVENDEFVPAKKQSIIEVNKLLKNGWVLLGISYHSYEMSSKIDYYVLGKLKVSSKKSRA